MNGAQQDANHIDRREVLRRAAGSAAVAMGGWWLLGAAGCASTSASRVGEPLPDDPVLTPVEPGGGGASEGRLARTGYDDIPPGVIARTSWARWGPNEARANAMGGIGRITVHHDGMNPFHDRGEGAAAARLEAIRSAHVSRRWADIGYHYAIDPAGRVWQGRPTYLQGAHVKDHNAHNLGILVMGNFERQRPTSAALASLEAFVAEQMRRYGVGLRDVYTHQELRPTACPGRNLQHHMRLARGRGGAIARA